MCTAEAAPSGDAFGPAIDRAACDAASGRPCAAACSPFTATGAVFTSTSQALHAADAALDYLNAVASDEAAGHPPTLDGAACGEVLIALGEIQARLTAAHAGFLRRFDAADAHDADGYGTSSFWLAHLAAKARPAQEGREGGGPPDAPAPRAAAA